MRQLRLPLLATLLLLAISAIAASTASAELPAILLLTKGVTSLEATFENKEEKEGVVHVLETTGKKSFTSTGAKLKWKGCLPLEGKEADTNLCHEGLLTFEGTKFEAASCRSENGLGEKDAVGVILAKVDMHLADEKSTAKLLVPLLMLKLEAVDKAKEIIVNCAGIKDKIKGIVGCLMLPGLKQIAANGEITIECEQENGKQITGTCEETKELCEELAKKPLEINFGTAFEKAGLEFNPLLKGSFPIETFIDD